MGEVGEGPWGATCHRPHPHPIPFPSLVTTCPPGATSSVFGFINISHPPASLPRSCWRKAPRPAGDRAAAPSGPSLPSVAPSGPPHLPELPVRLWGGPARGASPLPQQDTCSRAPFLRLAPLPQLLPKLRPPLLLQNLLPPFSGPSHKYSGLLSPVTALASPTAGLQQSHVRCQQVFRAHLLCARHFGAGHLHF